MERIAAAPTHIVYITRGGGRARITQSYGIVVAESDASVTLQTVAANDGFSGRVTVASADLLARKDNQERVSDEEMDRIFAEHGHRQV